MLPAFATPILVHQTSPTFRSTCPKSRPCKMSSSIPSTKQPIQAKTPSPTLYDLILPGTHDSAAYSTQPNLVSRSTILPLRFRPVRRAVSSVQSDFAITQTLTVLQQLHAGARFLDIRVSKPPKSSSDQRFWTVHGMVLCVPLEEIIDQINQYHDQTTGPAATTVVTVFRSQLLEANEDEQLASFVRNRIKHSVFEGDRDDLRDVPYASLPRNVIAGLRGAKLNVDWGKDPWLDTYSADKKIAFLRETLVATKHRDLRNDLLVLGWTVTPSVWDITFRVISLGLLRPSVTEEAVKMNARFKDFYAKFRAELAQRTNVIFFDSFDGKLSRMVEQLNLELDTDDSTS